MKANDQSHYLKTPETLIAMPTDLFSMTPLGFMLRGYGAAATCFSINDVVVAHLHEAALAQARAVQAFSHEAAAIWIEPVPVSPMAAVVKMTQTQTALQRHLDASAADGLARFDALQASTNDLLKAEQ